MNNQPRQWTQVAATSGSNNPRWEPTKIAFDPNNPPSIEGYFKSLSQIPGPNGTFNVAAITLVNPDGSLGQTVDVSGGAVLDEKLSQITLGSFIMIRYLGKHPSKTPGRTYNSWETFVDEGAINLSQLVQAPIATQPVFQQPVNVAPQFVPPVPQPVYQNVAPVSPAPFTPTAQPAFVPPVQQVAAPIQQVPVQFTQQVPVPQQPNLQNPFNTGDDLPF